MAKYICSKCGSKAESKCAYSRTIFPDNQQAAVISWLVKSKVEMLENDRGTVTITCDLLATETDILSEALDIIKNHVNEIKINSCKHDYILQDSTCELGCHKKDN